MDYAETLPEFIERLGIRLSAKWADSNPNMDDSANMDHWRVTLKLGRKQMTIPFSMGYGHGGKEPEVADVLSCLASDSTSADESFEDWCSEFGYDTDSRRAERTWRIVGKQAERLEKFLGADEYANLLENVEPY